MKHVKIRKIAIGLVSAFIFTASVVNLSACKIETDHPEVQITYEFNSKTYDVKYKLYRNMYPNTVRHFIELSEVGFYDNTVIHNYTSTDWFGGGYGYDAVNYEKLSGNSSQMSEYFELENVNKEDAYVQLHKNGTLTSTVYSNMSQFDEDKNLGDYVVKYKTSSGQIQTVKSEDALPYLFGEFYENINQEIESGKLTSEYGCLKMFYYKKESTQKVYVTPTRDQIIMADYKSNCATSVFSVQSGSSSSYSSSNYSVFGVLVSEDEFAELIDAINDYKTDNFADSTSGDFIVSATVRVDNNDEFSNKSEADRGKSETFNVPVEPIIIKNVKVTRY